MPEFIFACQRLLFFSVCCCCVSMGKGKPVETVQTAIYFAALAKLTRDNMGTVSSARDCRFFQIAYLPLKLYQKVFFLFVC